MEYPYSHGRCMPWGIGNGKRQQICDFEVQPPPHDYPPRWTQEKPPVFLPADDRFGCQYSLPQQQLQRRRTEEAEQQRCLLQQQCAQQQFFGDELPMTGFHGMSKLDRRFYIPPDFRQPDSSHITSILRSDVEALAAERKCCKATANSGCGRDVGEKDCGKDLAKLSCCKEAARRQCGQDAGQQGCGKDFAKLSCCVAAAKKGCGDDAARKNCGKEVVKMSCCKEAVKPSCGEEPVKRSCGKEAVKLSCCKETSKTGCGEEPAKRSCGKEVAKLSCCKEAVKPSCGEEPAKRSCGKEVVKLSCCKESSKTGCGDGHKTSTCDSGKNSCDKRGGDGCGGKKEKQPACPSKPSNACYNVIFLPEDVMRQLGKKGHHRERRSFCLPKGMGAIDPYCQGEDYRVKCGYQPEKPGSAVDRTYDPCCKWVQYRDGTSEGHWAAHYQFGPEGQKYGRTDRHRPHCPPDCPTAIIEIGNRSIYPKCGGVVPGYGGHVPGEIICKFGKTIGRETGEALRHVRSNHRMSPSFTMAEWRTKCMNENIC